LRSEHLRGEMEFFNILRDKEKEIGGGRGREENRRGCIDEPGGKKRKAGRENFVMPRKQRKKGHLT